MGTCISKKPSNFPALPVSPHTPAESLEQLKQYFDAAKESMTPKLHPYFEKAISKTSRGETELVLKFVVLEGEQAEHLARVIPFYGSLHALRLWKTKLGAEGAKALAPALRTLKHLETLSLEDNLLGTEGVVYISEALCHSSKLRTLVLHVNKISSDGGNPLYLICKSNPKLQHMQLNENRLGIRGFTELIEGLLLCGSTLKVLEIAHNEIQAEGAEVLLGALPRLVALEKVVVSGNNVGEIMEMELFRRAPRVHFYF